MSLKQIIKNLFVLFILLAQASAWSEEYTGLNLQIPKNTIDSNEEQDKLNSLTEYDNETQKKLKRKSFTRKVDYRYAFYAESIRKKIETVFLRYPNKAEKLKVDTEVKFILEIKSDGNLEKIKIERSSGNFEFDNSLLDLIGEAAPFNKFSEEMSKQAEVMSFTYDYFIKKNQLPYIR